MKIKKICFLLTLLMSFTCICSLTSDVKVKADKATNTLDELFNIQDFLGRDYSSLANTKQIGKYYTRGLNIGQRQVIEYGNIKLSCFEIEQITTPTMVSDNLSLVITDTSTLTIVNQITASAKVTIGIQQMASAGVNLEGCGNVGASTTLTQEYELGFVKVYSEQLTKDREVVSEKNLSVIPKDKKLYNIGRISVFLDCYVNKSYVEEHFWGKWWPQKGADKGEVSNYYMRYYIKDLITFVYNDNTFGNTEQGTYPLNVIKEYE